MTSKATPTQGPYTASSYDPDWECYKILSPSGETVCDAFDEADAALIAASWDLKQALITVANVGSGEAQRVALEALRSIDERE